MTSDGATGARSGRQPRRYEIWVRGHLGETMRSAFPAPAGSAAGRGHRADGSDVGSGRAVWSARRDRGPRARAARSPPPAAAMTGHDHPDVGCRSRQILRIVRGGLIRPSARLGADKARRPNRAGADGTRNRIAENGFHEGAGIPGHRSGARLAHEGGGATAHVAAGVVAPDRRHRAGAGHPGHRALVAWNQANRGRAGRPRPRRGSPWRQPTGPCWRAGGWLPGLAAVSVSPARRR